MELLDVNCCPFSNIQFGRWQNNALELLQDDYQHKKKWQTLISHQQQANHECNYNLINVIYIHFNPKLVFYSFSFMFVCKKNKANKSTIIGMRHIQQNIFFCCSTKRNNKIDI